MGSRAGADAYDEGRVNKPLFSACGVESLGEITNPLSGAPRWVLVQDGPQRWGKEEKAPFRLVWDYTPFFHLSLSTNCSCMRFLCLFECYLTGRLQSLECAGIIPGLETGKNRAKLGTALWRFSVSRQAQVACQFVFFFIPVSIILELDCGIKKVARISIILA